MPQDIKYGRVTVEHTAKFTDDNEPVFVLRAQDVLALATLYRYREMARECGCSDSFIGDLTEAGNAFAAWKGERKRPD